MLIFISRCDFFCFWFYDCVVSVAERVATL